MGMAYTKFSTGKADYVLQLGKRTENIQNLFEGIDALVTETGENKPEALYLWARTMGSRPDGKPIEYCRKNNIPIFMTDAPTTELGHYRCLLSGCIEMFLPPMLIPLFYHFSNKRVNKFLGRLHGDYTFILQSPVEARNALNARKIEEFVVPRIKEILDKKHPKIGIDFDAGHIGLEYHLKSKLRRDLTLWNWKNLNFSKYVGLDKKQLNKVYEANYNMINIWDSSENWLITEHNTDLFD